MNRLANETSPYLLLHKDNPVDWWPWGADALAAAQDQNKPILLSIGYTACHWCHVMEEESFTDTATAKTMNDDFINIKVDREERPDIDQIYQAAANLMGHTGGWPLTVILTPKGVPFFAGTYFPKEERAGQVPFTKVLADITRAFKEEGSQIQDGSARVIGQLENLWNRDMHGPIESISLDVAALRIGQRFDVFFGGAIGNTKFPSVSLLEVLWRAFLRSGLPQFQQFSANSLDHMLLGGLYDHVGGGFFRYCTDERWLIPHFEKMLNDNAALIEIMTSCWQFNRNTLCKDRVADTIGWMMRDMRVQGGFAASLDADSDGEEGKYYAWSEAEIDAALKGTFVQKFKQIYNVQREGMFKGRNVLQRIGSAAPFPQPDADEALVAKQRELLLKTRTGRVMPMRDDKVMADWNGLAIAALAIAGTVFQRAEWTTTAIETFDFVLKTMGEGDRLYHSWRDGKRGPAGFADDYAHMTRAALILFEKTGEKRYLEQAKKWVRTLNEHFWDKDRGAYCFTADDSTPLIVRARMMFDQPTHSANGRMLEILARLFMTTGEKEYSERASALVAAIAGEVQRAFISMGAVLSGFEYAANSLHIAVIGPLNNIKTHELVAAIHGRPLPDLCLSVVSPEESFPTGHPLHGKTMQNGLPTVYICQRGACSQPITNPVALSQMLQLPRTPVPGTRPQ